MPPERPGLTGEENKIHGMLASMGDVVDQAIGEAMHCLLERDIAGAQAVVSADQAINALQYAVEEEAVTTIALQQPVASDLRELVADAFIAAELERIADHAADIAAIVAMLEEPPAAAFASALENLAAQGRSMLRAAMQAYIARDEAAARAIAARDDEVDRDEAALTRQLISHICEHPKDCIDATRLQWVAHHLERIADRVTNITERTVMVVTGEVVDLNSGQGS